MQEDSEIKGGPPRLDILIQDDTSTAELANALRAAREFVRKVAPFQDAGREFSDRKQG